MLPARGCCLLYQKGDSDCFIQTMTRCQFDTFLMYKGTTGNHNVYLISPEDRY